MYLVEKGVDSDSDCIEFLLKGPFRLEDEDEAGGPLEFVEGFE